MSLAAVASYAALPDAFRNYVACSEGVDVFRSVAATVHLPPNNDFVTATGSIAKVFETGVRTARALGIFNVF